MISRSDDDSRRILDVGVEATDEEIRAAYLKLVKQHPPDRDPVEFERVRDAYERLRNPRRRAHDALFAGPPVEPLEEVADSRPAPRKFLGPKPWLAVLKEK